MRFGAEFMEEVQPSRCLLGGCVFKGSREFIVESRELKVKSKAFNAEGAESLELDAGDAVMVDF